MENLKDKACGLIDNILDYVELVHGTDKLKEMQQDPSLIALYFQEYIEKQKLLLKKIQNLDPDTKKSFFDMRASQYYTKVAIQNAEIEHRKHIESILRKNNNLKYYD